MIAETDGRWIFDNSRRARLHAALFMVLIPSGIMPLRGLDVKARGSDPWGRRILLPFASRVLALIVRLIAAKGVARRGT